MRATLGSILRLAKDMLLPFWLGQAARQGSLYIHRTKDWRAKRTLATQKANSQLAKQGEIVRNLKAHRLSCEMSKIFPEDCLSENHYQSLDCSNAEYIMENTLARSTSCGTTKIAGRRIITSACR